MPFLEYYYFENRSELPDAVRVKVFGNTAAVDAEAGAAAAAGNDAALDEADGAGGAAVQEVIVQAAAS